MRNLVLLLALLTSTIILSQSESFKKGFEDGYCKAHKEKEGIMAICPTSPIPPLPEIYKDTYQDGFIKGMKAYNDKLKGSKNGNEILIDVQKDVSESQGFVNYGETFSNSLKNSLGSMDIKTTKTYIDISINKLKDNREFKYIVVNKITGINKGATRRGIIERIQESNYSTINLEKPKKTHKKYPEEFKTNPELFVFLDVHTDKYEKVLENTLESYSVERDFKRTIKLYNHNEVLIYKGVFMNIPSSERYNEILDKNFKFKNQTNTSEEKIITRDEAIKRLKETKELYDLKILNKTEYDSIVVRLKKYLSN